MDLFSRYLDSIAEMNNLGDGSAQVRWYFYPGMLQDSPDKWWADFGFRHASHEGIDICFYNSGKGVRALEPGARIPALDDGVVLNISNDLLGQSIAVSYNPGLSQNSILSKNDSVQLTPILVYSHLEPCPELAQGDRVSKGQRIATIFDTRKKKSKLLSHLHLSCLLIFAGFLSDELDWSLFADRGQVTYINPVFL